MTRGSSLSRPDLVFPVPVCRSRGSPFRAGLEQSQRGEAKRSRNFSSFRPRVFPSRQASVAPILARSRAGLDSLRGQWKRRFPGARCTLLLARRGRKGISSLARLTGYVKDRFTFARFSVPRRAAGESFLSKFKIKVPRPIRATDRGSAKGNGKSFARAPSASRKWPRI